MQKKVWNYFYKYFRDEIYKRQLMELKESFKNKPKVPAIRAIYDKKVYLYFHNGKVFPEVVSERLWRQNKKFEELVFELNIINIKIIKS